MRIRTTLALAVTVPALVAGLAQPAAAQSRDVVTFEGTFQLKPTALPQQQVTSVCFFTVTCQNGAEPSGMAAGAGIDQAALQAHVVDGLQATATYTESCAPGTGFQPIGSAQLTGAVHDQVSGWKDTSLRATWTRVGLVAVIQGDAVGTALFTPVGVPACGVASPVAVAGVVTVAY